MPEIGKTFSTIYSSYFTKLVINTILKEMRSKMLLSLFIISIAFMLGLHVLFAFFTSGMEYVLNMGATKISIFYMFIIFWATMLSCVLGGGVIRSDLEDKISHQILSFPVSTYQYTLSRIVGTWFLVNFYCIFCFVLAIFFFIDKSTVEFSLAHYAASYLLTALGLLFMIVISIIGSMLLPALVTFLGSLFVYGVIVFTNSYFVKYELKMFADIWSFISGFIYYLVPRMGIISDYSSLLLKNGKIDSYWSMAGNLLHFGLTLALFFWLLNLILRKKSYEL